MFLILLAPTSTSYGIVVYNLLLTGNGDGGRWGSIRLLVAAIIDPFGCWTEISREGPNISIPWVIDPLIIVILHSLNREPLLLNHWQSLRSQTGAHACLRFLGFPRKLPSGYTNIKRSYSYINHRSGILNSYTGKLFMNIFVQYLFLMCHDKVP